MGNKVRIEMLRYNGTLGEQEREVEMDFKEKRSVDLNRLPLTLKK
ncbi:MAG: hypothetical protein ACTJHT_00155 [Sphingobacterium sp.]|nr:hypothetical protein [Sphingobacterium sp. JB170]SJN20841.1 hypothetical protein FM107_02515 [Sphingobacterium sp. JB170]